MHHKIFPADLDYLHKMLDFIQIYVQTKQISAAALSKIVLAAEEAIVNIINYGYPEAKGFIEIYCKDSQEKHGIIIQIRDEGIPFNPTTQLTVKDSSTKIDESELGGYGINIFIGMMDRVEYQRLEKANLLSLIKYL
jgi:serine/threonine-protein kinase RsbW